MYRGSRWVACVGVALLASSAHAQSAARSPRQMGEIINAALHAVIPAENPPGSHPIADVAGREVRLDYGRTMTAFGLANNADVRAKLGLTHAEGSHALFEDCDQMGAGPCKQLGRAVYTYVEPLSISNSEARVQVHVIWANKPSTRTFLSVWVTEVILTRSRSGPWKFLKLGRGVIS